MACYVGNHQPQQAMTLMGICYNVSMDNGDVKQYPLPIARAWEAAQLACTNGEEACHGATLRLADALTFYLGAISVAQYSQALYTGLIEGDPTLHRSLRSLRRVLPGQWLLWVARGLEATPAGPVSGSAEWYFGRKSERLASAYEGLRQIMVGRLGYTGEYGPQEAVSPRLLLELLDQYRIRRSKAPAEYLTPDMDRQVAEATLPGLGAMLEGAAFLREYSLYAPQQSRLLMGLEATTPMPPIPAPLELADAATLLLYPPGEAPDYTRRPDLQNERSPLFPLDPLLVYLRCGECDRYRVAALRELSHEKPTYVGLDPDCGHSITPSTAN